MRVEPSQSQVRAQVMEGEPCGEVVTLESSDEEGPDDILLTAGKVEAMERKRRELEAVKR